MSTNHKGVVADNFCDQCGDEIMPGVRTVYKVYDTTAYQFCGQTCFNEWRNL